MVRWSRFPRIVCALVVCVLGVSAASSDVIEIAAERQGGKYFAWIEGEVAGVTAVQMQKDGSGEWTPYEIRAGGEFDVESEEFATLAEMNAEIVGDYVLQITHAGGVSQYNFSIGPVLAEQFPASPVLADVGATVPREQPFSWTWSGTADLKYVEYDGWDGNEGFEFGQLYAAGAPGFDDLSLLADFGAYTGSAEFLISYANEAMGLVTSWSLREGDTALFGASEVRPYVISSDELEFQVVPEPTALALLALGGLGLIRRRRR